MIMQSSNNVLKINSLLEEIANEIQSAEQKNRELYTSAIDVEDEEQSLKIQAESFQVIRKMKRLKVALDAFKNELKNSGIGGSERGDSPGES